MKLRNKINLSTAVLFAFLLILMNVSIYLLFSHLIIVGELSTAKKETVRISQTKSFNDLLGTPQEVEILRAYVPVNGMISSVNYDGSTNPVTSPTEQELSKRSGKFYQGEQNRVIVENKRTYIFTSIPIIRPDGTIANLQIIENIEPTTTILKTLRLVLLAVTLLALIPVFISSWILSNFITKPVALMTETMTEIRKSGQFKRLALAGTSKDELFQMGQTFNHMIDLLENNFEKQKQFVSNASHELKTPITIIESYASLLKRRGIGDQQLFAESIEAIHSEAVRMRDLTQQLLVLARHDEGWSIVMSKVDIGGLLQQTVKAFQDAYSREVFFEKSSLPIVVETEEQRLKQLLFIFLDNARKYSEDVITVSTKTEDNEAVIMISDRGEGIPEDAVPKVFDRFYRLDQSRSRKSGGSGLGLSLAKEIAAAIGIRISLQSKVGVGTTVSLFIPPKRAVRPPSQDS